MENTTHTITNVTHKLLVEFVFKHTHGLLRKIKSPYPVQGLHFTYGFRFKNIGDVELPGGKLNNVKIKFVTTETHLESPDIHYIPQLTPGQSVIIYTNNTIFNYPGAIWVSCEISADTGQVQTYQCSRGHKNYVPINPIGKWSNGDYIVPHMEYLQSLTNWHIFLLTVVTLVLGLVGIFL